MIFGICFKTFQFKEKEERGREGESDGGGRKEERNEIFDLRNVQTHREYLSEFI